MFGKDLFIKQMLKKQLRNLPPEEQAKAEAAMQDEEMLAQVQKLVEQLSPDEQRELMQGVLTGNMAAAQKILSRLEGQDKP